MRAADVEGPRMDATEGAPGVLIIGNYPPPYGGVPKHIEDLAPGLARCGWRVHILSGGTTGIERRDGITIYKDARPWGRRRIDTLKFAAAVTGRGNAAILRTYADLVPFGRYLSYIGRAALGAQITQSESIDIIAGYNLTVGAPVAMMLGEIFNLPVIVSNFGEIYSHREIVERERELIRRITERAARLLCMTRHCADSYEALGLRPPVQIIPYGLDFDRFAPGDGTAYRRQLGFGDEHRIVLFVGRMVPDMGLDTLLETIPAITRNVARARFVVAGGRGSLTGAAEAVAAKMPEVVKVLVDVPAADLPTLYRASDLVVVPTKGARACGSLAAGEASASARAVVGARVGGVPEYVVDGETGVLVPPADPLSLAAAVCSLLEDDEHRRCMGLAGHKWVRRRFDARDTNEAMDSVLREVLGRRSKRLPIAVT